VWMPLYIDVSGMRVLVAGGGRVGEGRALAFARAGARVRVAALEFTGGLLEAGRRGLVELVRVDLRDPGERRRLIEWSNLVVVAVGDPRLASEIAGEARGLGRLVNNAVKASEGNVVVPFRGSTSYGLHVAVTSLGRAGVAARESLEAALALLEDCFYKTLYESMARLKEWLKSNVASAEARMHGYFAAASSEQYREAVADCDPERAYREALTAARRAIESLGAARP